MTPEMTPQEAIFRIDYLIALEEYFIKEYPMGKKGRTRSLEAFKIARQALEFRTAKKVETIVSNEDVKLGAMTMKAGTKVFKCTNCNSYVSPSHKFCTECGQALEF